MADADRLEASVKFTEAIQSLPDPVECWRVYVGAPLIELGIDPPSIGLT